MSRNTAEFRPRPGFLKRQAESIEKEAQNWPDWMKGETAREAGERGLTKATAGADPQWLEIAYAALKWVALRRLEFTADDVWAALGGNKGNGSAMGAVFRRAAKEKLIRNTGKFSRSEREATHGRPISVWRSLMFTGGLTVVQYRKRPCGKAA